MGETPEKPAKKVTPVGKLLIGLAVLGTVAIGASAVNSPDTNKTANVQTVTTAASHKPEVEAAATETKQFTTTESVPFATKTTDDPTLAKGQTKTIQEGKDGVKTLTYSVTYTGNQETNRTLLSDAVTTPPVDKLVHNGTYVAPASAPAAASNCNPNYSGCVPNVSYDLNCIDIKQKVSVIGTDVYHLDADHDGYGCESYN